MKTVLFLINGLGIENNNSYSIYNNEIMPNLFRLNKSYLSSVLKSNVNNYIDGYRNISLDINEPYSYTIFNESVSNNSFSENATILEIKNKIEERKSKLQIFCFIDKSPLIVDNLKQFLTKNK